MPERATIIANRPRLDALRAMTGFHDGACACNLIRLGYLPERKVGRVTHGALTCYRQGDKP